MTLTAPSTVLTLLDGRELTSDNAAWLDAKAIRTEVFIEEQNCPVDEEFDGKDVESRHLLMRLDDGEAIGTARWRVVEDEGVATAKLERFAVRPPHRGGGVGRLLVEAVLEDALAQGHRRFMLHAQEYLVDFYRAFGFITVGKRFIEAGIPHRRMVRVDD